MIRELFLQDLSLWSCVWQSTLLVMIGLVGSFLLRRRPSRAFQVLLLAMIAAVAVPAMSVLVKHFELGAFVAKPIALQPISMDLYSAVLFESPKAITESQPNAEGRLDVALVEGGSANIYIPWRPILLFGWLTATLALLGRLFFAFINGVRMIRRSQPDVRKHIQQALDRAKSQLGIKNNLQIRASGEIYSPMIWCWSRKAVLLIPCDLNNNVDWVGVICHELAHYMRRDHICGLMAELTSCILCWNPLSWLAKKRLIRLGEQACDDWVVAGGQPIENYARSLLNFKPQKQVAFVPAVVHSRKGVAARVRRILQDSRVDPRTGVRWALVVSLITTCSAAAVAFAQTRPAHPTTAIAPETKSTNSVLQAAAAGDINQVKTLLSQGVDINVKDDGGLTPLHHAIKEGHMELARFLIDHGADLEAKERKWDYTPLLYAVQFGNTEIVEVLVNKGVDVNYTPKMDYSPLINVIWGKDECRYNMAKLLVDHGASFDVKAQDGWTAFAYAAWDGCDDVIELFVAKGADISTFHMAACMGDLDRVKDFVEHGAHIDAKDEVGWTPIFWAVCMRRSEVIQYLIAQGANVNLRIGQTTALHRAALAGTKDIVQLLITQGADVNARDKRGNTPLHEAFNKKEIADLLIRKGADVNVRNSLGRTPLWIAARRGHIEIVRILIANGADVNAKDRDDKTPLDQAVMEGEWSILALLVANGAEAEISSIHVVAAIGNVAKVKAFLENAVDGNARNSQNMTPLHAASANGHKEVVELLISRNADVNVKDIDDGTPLHFASGAGHKDVAELLIAKGADVNAKYGDGETPLHWAAWEGDKDVAELLISKGAGVNTKTKEGRTALHEAATQGHRSIVELLIGKNADINTKDNQGQTALQLAKENGHSEIFELLRKHGAKE